MIYAGSRNKTHSKASDQPCRSPTTIFQHAQKTGFPVWSEPRDCAVKAFRPALRPAISCSTVRRRARGRASCGWNGTDSRTLRAMGTVPEDPIVKQIGSEFRMLFCPAASAAKMKSQPGASPIDPAKSISDLLREPPRTSAAAAALRKFVALCRRAILSRLRRSFL